MPTGHFDPIFGSSFTQALKNSCKRDETVSRWVIAEELPSHCWVIGTPLQLSSTANLHSAQSSLAFTFTDFLTRHVKLLPHTFCLSYLLSSAVGAQILKEQLHTHTPSRFLFCMTFASHLHYPLTHHRHPQFSSVLLPPKWLGNMGPSAVQGIERGRKHFNCLSSFLLSNFLWCVCVSVSVSVCVWWHLYCLHKLRMCKSFNMCLPQPSLLFVNKCIFCCISSILAFPCCT